MTREEDERRANQRIADGIRDRAAAREKADREEAARRQRAEDEAERQRALQRINNDPRNKP